MKKISPWFYIPSLYFLEGMPYIIINTVSVVLYADLGYPNDQIAFWTGWLYLPWILKMFWSPVVDGNGTKRRWLLAMQLFMAAVFIGLAAVNAWNVFSHAQAVHNLTFFSLSLFGLLAGAFVSATLDIATDGYYLLALTAPQQGYFVGVRTIFYRLAMIFGSGLLISATGALAVHLPKYQNWSVMFLFLAVLFGAGALWHKFIMPAPDTDQPARLSDGKSVWVGAFKTYFTQQNILYILLFILLYRFGEALLEKIVPLFLLKPTAEGALGLSMQQYGLIKGTLGLGAIIAGNLAGGWLLGKFGFKKCIWPFAIALVLPNFFYVYLAMARPGLVTVAALITVENFGYGLAMMALTVFIMYVSQGAYKTSHYAISTGVLALGMMIPSMLSGKLQLMLGYEQFFWVTAFISLITFAIVPLTARIKTIDETEKAFRK
ncbi:MAG: MFS transporter [Elusimicrobiaceae bacterium]|nr:MFS transporter [Elusimicrobiaceae bacterium]